MDIQITRYTITFTVQEDFDVDPEDQTRIVASGFEDIEDAVAGMNLLGAGAIKLGCNACVIENSNGAVDDRLYVPVDGDWMQMH